MVKRHEPVAYHQSQIRLSVHGRFDCHIPHNVFADSSYRHHQRTGKLFFNPLVAVLAPDPVFPLLIKKVLDLMDHHLELAGIRKPVYKRTARQHLTNWNPHQIIHAHKITIDAVYGFLKRGGTMPQPHVLQTYLTPCHDERSIHCQTTA